LRINDYSRNKRRRNTTEEIPLCRSLDDAYPDLAELKGEDLKKAIIGKGYTFFQNLSPQHADPENWFGMGPAPFKEMLLAPAYRTNGEPDPDRMGNNRIGVYIITHTAAGK